MNQTVSLSSPRLWDISAPIAPDSPVFSGDTPYQQEWAAEISADCPVNVSRLTLSPHVGTHADAPLHYSAGGQSAGALDLQPFIGACRVIHAVGCGPLVRWEDIAHAVDDRLPPRVLVRTYAQMPTTQWDEHFSAYAPETIERLAALGVVLVGIDSASVDPATSKSLDSHHNLARHNLRVLENLVLDDVPEGDYELIALPLKLLHADASPVRAILREL